MNTDAVEMEKFVLREARELRLHGVAVRSCVRLDLLPDMIAFLNAHGVRVTFAWLSFFILSKDRRTAYFAHDKKIDIADVDRFIYSENYITSSYSATVEEAHSPSDMDIPHAFNSWLVDCRLQPQHRSYVGMHAANPGYPYTSLGWRKPFAWDVLAGRVELAREQLMNACSQSIQELPHDVLCVVQLYLNVEEDMFELWVAIADSLCAAAVAGG